MANFRFQLDRKLGFRVRAKNCKIEKAGRTLPTGVLLPACVVCVCVYDLYNIYANIYAYDLPRRSSSQEVLLLWLQKGNWAGVHLQLLLNPPSKTNIFITFPFPVHASTSPLLDLLWSQWPGIFIHSWNNCLKWSQWIGIFVRSWNNCLKWSEWPRIFVHPVIFASDESQTGEWPGILSTFEDRGRCIAVLILVPSM